MNTQDREKWKKIVEETQGMETSGPVYIGKRGKSYRQYIGNEEEIQRHFIELEWMLEDLSKWKGSISTVLR